MIQCTDKEDQLMRLSAKETALKMKATGHNPPAGIWLELQEISFAVKALSVEIMKNDNLQTQGDEGVTARGTVYNQYLEQYMQMA